MPDELVAVVDLGVPRKPEPLLLVEQAPAEPSPDPPPIPAPALSVL